MARDTCPRCGATIHTTTEPPGSHVCADLAARLKRRERQVEAVEGILTANTLPRAASLRSVAEVIVKRLAGMGVSDD